MRKCGYGATGLQDILNAAKVPAWALWLQGAWAAFLVLPRTFNPATRAYGNLYGNLLDYVISAALIFYILTIAGIFRLRSTRPEDYPASARPHADALRGRSMLVRKTEPFAIECVARGYLSGSGWKEYQQSGSVCGIKLPPGLRESDRLPEPIFTPATKAATGHDINISEEEAGRIVGNDTIQRLRQLTLRLYSRGAAHAEHRGIIVADTKFEFGRLTDGPHKGEIILIDEVLTPDSSRFWPRDLYTPGGPQPSYDKQFVRDYLESIRWNKQPPVPTLPDDVVAKTRDKYLQAFRVLTGLELE